MANEEHDKQSVKGRVMLASMGLTLVITTILGFFAGYFLDQWLKTSPWLSLIFLVLGVLAGFKSAHSTLKKYGN